MNLVTAALNGGEDYELLFTVPLTDHEKVSKLPGVKVIGHITKPELGCAMITRDDVEMPLKAQGRIRLPGNSMLRIKKQRDALKGVPLSCLLMSIKLITCE